MYGVERAALARRHLSGPENYEHLQKALRQASKTSGRLGQMFPTAALMGRNPGTTAAVAGGVGLGGLYMGSQALAGPGGQYLGPPTGYGTAGYSPYA